MTTILSALGCAIAYSLAAIFIAGMIAGCAATVLAHRHMKGR